MSAEVASHAGCLEDVGPVADRQGARRAEPMQVIGVARGRDLPASILIAGEGEDDKAGRRGNTQGMVANP